MLPVCLGEATKVSQYLLDSDKEYLATVVLGQRTSTADAEGEVIASAAVDIDDQSLAAALERQRGDIEQLPPMYSALKLNGQPLYKLAREGKSVERDARRVSIYRNELLSRSDNELELFVACSKGTYIRSIADDLGQDLGCGGHIGALRRLKAGCFGIENRHSDAGQFADRVVSLEQLESQGQLEGPESLDQYLVPMDAAIEHLPAVSLPALAADSIRHGQAVLVRHLPSDGLVRLYAESEENDESRFIGIGEIDDDGKVAPRRLIVDA